MGHPFSLSEEHPEMVLSLLESPLRRTLLFPESDSLRVSSFFEGDATPRNAPEERARSISCAASESDSLAARCSLPTRPSNYAQTLVLCELACESISARLCCNTSFCITTVAVVSCNMSVTIPAIPRLYANMSICSMSM